MELEINMRDPHDGTESTNSISRAGEHESHSRKFAKRKRYVYIYKVWFLAEFHASGCLEEASMVQEGNHSTGSNDAEDATTWDILACTWNLELLFDVRKRNKLNFRRCFFFSLSSFPPGISESFIKLFDLLKLRDVILIAVQKEFYNSLQLEICLSSISILRFFGEIYI